MHGILATILGYITWYGFLSKHPIMQEEMKKWETKIRKFLNF